MKLHDLFNRKWCFPHDEVALQTVQTVVEY